MICIHYLPMWIFLRKATKYLKSIQANHIYILFPNFLGDPSIMPVSVSPFFFFFLFKIVEIFFDKTKLTKRKTDYKIEKISTGNSSNHTQSQRK